MTVFNDNNHNKPRPVGANNATTEDTKPNLKQELIKHLDAMIANLSVEYIKKVEQENANLKAQLSAKNEPLSKAEQLPVYEEEILQTVDDNPLEIDGFKADYKALYEAQTKAIIAAKDTEIAELKQQAIEDQQDYKILLNGLAERDKELIAKANEIAHLKARVKELEDSAIITTVIRQSKPLNINKLTVSR